VGISSHHCMGAVLEYDSLERLAVASHRHFLSWQGMSRRSTMSLLKRKQSSIYRIFNKLRRKKLYQLVTAAPSLLR
jgi:hypothetical protein